MKKILTLSLAFSALVFTATAQEQREIKKDRSARTEGRAGMKGDRKGMMNDLNLTEAQKSQLKANREAYKQKIEALKAQNLTEAQMKEQRKALHAEQKAKMESILTAEQKAKMAEKRKSFGERGRSEGRKGMKGNHEDFKTKLGLTDDQAAKLKAQRTAMKAKKDAIRNDQSLSQEAKKEKMKALKADAKAQRNSILTAEQIQKLEALKKEHKGKGHKGKGFKKAKK